MQRKNGCGKVQAIEYEGKMQEIAAERQTLQNVGQRQSGQTSQTILPVEIGQRQMGTVGEL